MLEAYTPPPKGRDRLKVLARRLPFMQSEGREGLAALALESGMSLDEFRAYLRDNAAELQGLALLGKFDGSGIVDQTNLLLHAGLARLIKELPDADLAEVLEIVKAAKNIKADEVRAEIARNSDIDKLPLINITIGRGVSVSVEPAPAPVMDVEAAIIEEGAQHG